MENPNAVKAQEIYRHGRDGGGGVLFYRYGNGTETILCNNGGRDAMIRGGFKQPHCSGGATVVLKVSVEWGNTVNLPSSQNAWNFAAEHNDSERRTELN